MTEKVEFLPNGVVTPAGLLSNALERALAGNIVEVVILERSPAGEVTAAWSDMKMESLTFFERIFALEVFKAISRSFMGDPS